MAHFGDQFGTLRGPLWGILEIVFLLHLYRPQYFEGGRGAQPSRQVETHRTSRGGGPRKHKYWSGVGFQLPGCRFEPTVLVLQGGGGGSRRARQVESHSTSRGRGGPGGKDWNLYKSNKKTIS